MNDWQTAVPEQSLMAVELFIAQLYLFSEYFDHYAARY
jgi:hypothetical protein